LSYNTLIPLEERYNKQKKLTTYILIIEICALAFSDPDPQKKHLSMLYTDSDPVTAVGSDQKELKTQIKSKKCKDSFLYLKTYHKIQPVTALSLHLDMSENFFTFIKDKVQHSNKNNQI